ncbi:hypothetical protein PHMEG_00040840 [Phytophthora megakarya]|uniref:Uncharacterized protein n=1 Tax=Phytophthora megakarya TaxID=4795 RepID=A0A225UE17_9STRA|nr:hypothetical protein PHMEG_00040840 [Phytophthora megakarya]
MNVMTLDALSIGSVTTFETKFPLGVSMSGNSALDRNSFCGGSNAGLSSYLKGSYVLKHVGSVSRRP